MKKIIMIMVLIFVGAAPCGRPEWWGHMGKGRHGGLPLQAAYAADGNATPGLKAVTIIGSGGTFTDSTRANFDSGTYTSNTQWWADEVKLADLMGAGPV